MRRLLSLLAVVMLCSGCHTYKYNEPMAGDESLVPKGTLSMYNDPVVPLGWLLSRCYDFVDMFGITFSNGTGYQLNVRATKLVQLGIGDIASVEKYGFYGRKFGLWQEDRMELGIGPIYWNRFKKHALNGGDFFQDWIPHDQEYDDTDTGHLNDRGWTEFGFTIHFLIGLEVYVDAIEILDFAIGWFPSFLVGYPVDLSHDDLWTRRTIKPH